MATTNDPGPLAGPATADKEFWRCDEYAPLVNYQQLKTIAQEDPWQYDVASRLKNFLFRMESKNVVNFRVSGIVVHSASMLCKAKSRSMVDSGAAIHDALAIDDAMVDDGTGDDGTWDDVLDGRDASDEAMARALASGKVDVDGVLDAIAGKHGTAGRALGKAYLGRFNVPRRVVARPLTVADLSVALNDALAGKYRRKQGQPARKNVVLPQAFTVPSTNELKVERLIEIVGEQVRTRFEQGGDPVMLTSLFEDLDNILLVVKTFMAVLHMINKKVIEAWQVEDGRIFIVPFGQGTTAGPIV